MTENAFNYQGKIIKLMHFNIQEKNLNLATTTTCDLTSHMLKLVE